MFDNPDQAPVADGATFFQGVPVIDVGGTDGLVEHNVAARVAVEIGDTCRDWGFSQIINHGVDEEHLTQVYRFTRDFFAMDRATKRQLRRSVNNPWGYFDRELTRNIWDKKVIFDIGPGIDESDFSAGPFSGEAP